MRTSRSSARRMTRSIVTVRRPWTRWCWAVVWSVVSRRQARDSRERSTPPNGWIREITMKLLIVNIYFHPDPTGTGLVITELARDLVAQGHEVTVITSVPHYGVSHPPAPEGHGARRLWQRLADSLRGFRDVRLWQEDR